MGLYGRYVPPRLTHMAMRQSQLLPYRERTIRSATGMRTEHPYSLLVCAVRAELASGATTSQWTGQMMRR